MPATIKQAVRLKSRADFDRLKTRKNAQSVHEPYNLIVFENDAAQKHNPDKVKSVGRAGDRIETGVAICYPKDRIEARAWLERNGYEIVKRLPMLYAVQVPLNMTFDEFYSLMMISGYFTKIVKDEISEQIGQVNLSETNDHFNFQVWHFKAMEAVAGIKEVPEGYQGDICVIDGHGFDSNHPDMAGMVSRTYNAVDGTTNILHVSDNEKHCEPCVGIGCAATNNSIGIPSLGYNRFKAHVIKIGWNPSASGTFYSSDLVKAAAVADIERNPNALVVSMSFGSSKFEQAFYDAITSARNNGRGGKGIAFLGSAGNSGLGEGWWNYPANYSGVACIGATTSADKRASYSNYGTRLHFSAPAGVSTIDRVGKKGYKSSGSNSPLIEDYNSGFSGTSASCPVATVVAAHMMAVNPNITEAQVREGLMATCDKTGNYNYTDGKSFELGYGRVNMKNAILWAKNFTPPKPKHNLTVSVSSPVTAEAGQKITIGVTVRTNQPAADQVGVPVRLHWSNDNYYSVSDPVVGLKVAVVGGGVQSKELSFEVIVPSGYGNRFAIAVVDPNNEVDETVETDNSSMNLIEVKLPPAPAGAEIDWVIATAEKQADGRVKLRYQFKNTGSVNISSYKLLKGFGTNPTGALSVLSSPIKPGGLSQISSNMLYPPTGVTEARIRISELNGLGYEKEIVVPIT